MSPTLEALLQLPHAWKGGVPPRPPRHLGKIASPSQSS